MAKSRFRTFDVFQKTVEEARIRTASGGLVTLVSAAIIFWLLVLEVWDWRRIVVRNELVVDSTRGINLLSLPFTPLFYVIWVLGHRLIAGERLQIHLNITFPHIPCSSTSPPSSLDRAEFSVIIGCYGCKWRSPN